MKLPESVRQFLAARLRPEEIAYIDRLLAIDRAARRRAPSMAAQLRRQARMVERMTKAARKEAREATRRGGTDGEKASSA